MARPRKEKKRERVSISVLPEVKALAESTGNASACFERSMLTCKAISGILAQLGQGRVKKETILETLEDIEDLIAVWERTGEESVPFAAVLAEMRQEQEVESEKATPRKRRKAS